MNYPNAWCSHWQHCYIFIKGEHEGKEIPLRDDAEAIAFLQDLWKNCDGSKEGFTEMAQQVLAWEKMWGRDLSTIPSFTTELADYLLQIEQEGIRPAVQSLLGVQV